MMKNIYSYILPVIIFFAFECGVLNASDRVDLRSEKYSILLEKGEIKPFNFGLYFSNSLRKALMVVKRIRQNNLNLNLVKGFEQFMILDIADYWYYGLPKIDNYSACQVYDVFSDYLSYIKKYHPNGVKFSNLDPILIKNYHQAIKEVADYKNKYSCEL